MKAVLNDVVVAESDETIVVEGNHYFPPDSIKDEHFIDNARTTVCPWKGTASYYDVSAGGVTEEGAAWYYPSTKEAANNIENYVAFYANRVTITE